jgi:hypothetical protein
VRSRWRRGRGFTRWRGGTALARRGQCGLCHERPRTNRCDSMSRKRNSAAAESRKARLTKITAWRELPANRCTAANVPGAPHRCAALRSGHVHKVGAVRQKARARCVAGISRKVRARAAIAQRAPRTNRPPALFTRHFNHHGCLTWLDRKRHRRTREFLHPRAGSAAAGETDSCAGDVCFGRRALGVFHGLDHPPVVDSRRRTL